MRGNPKINHRGEVWCQDHDGGCGAYLPPDAFTRGCRGQRFQTYCRLCKNARDRHRKRVRYREDPAFRAYHIRANCRRDKRRRRDEAKAAVQAVKQLRARGLTGRQIAALVGCHEATVSSWLHGRQLPKAPRQTRIFAALRKTSPAVLG